MSNKANNAAFPMPHFTRPDGDIEWGSFGVTKRELAAFIALQGAIANPGRHGSPQEYADFAIVCADTLLRELAK